MQDLVFMILFWEPILAVILLRSVLYDGWRHLYFVYPAFLLIAIKGFVVLWNARGAIKYQRIALGSVTAISILYLTVWIWRAHPFQNVYFNVFAGRGLRNRYEMDYWGLGNRRAIEYILAREQNPIINIAADSVTLLGTTMRILKPNERDRVRFANDNSGRFYLYGRDRVRLADDNSGPFYILTNYRMVKDMDDSKYSRDYQLYYQIKIDSEVILSVYKRN
jgi:hypothetical protein